MEIRASDTNVRVQSEINGITRRMINVEQQSLAAQTFIKAPITKPGSFRCGLGRDGPFAQRLEYIFIIALCCPSKSTAIITFDAKVILDGL